MNFVHHSFPWLILHSSEEMSEWTKTPGRFRYRASIKMQNELWKTSFCRLTGSESNLMLKCPLGILSEYRNPDGLQLKISSMLAVLIIEINFLFWESHCLSQMLLQLVSYILLLAQWEHVRNNLAHSNMILTLALSSLECMDTLKRDVTKHLLFSCNNEQLKCAGILLWVGQELLFSL